MSRFAVVVVLGSACLVGEACSSSGGPAVTGPGTAAGSVTFNVPASGGSVDVAATSGQKVTFDFPASAAGKTLVLTPTDATSIGWTAADFSDVIRMEPDGTQFADPVLVRPASGGVMLATFPSAAAKSAPEWLALRADGKGGQLHHFSTLAIVAASRCSFTSHTGSPQCAQALPGGGTLLDTACDLPQLCSRASVSCCVDPSSGATSCLLGNAALSFAPTPLLGASSPTYCGGAIDSGSSVDASPSDASSSDASASDSGGDASSDGGPGDAAVGDATVDSGVNGNCGSTSFSAGDGGAGTCQVSRIDGKATLLMVCSPTACHCYTNNTSEPYGAPFSSGTTDCASPQLALQQMLAFCGCP